MGTTSSTSSAFPYGPLANSSNALPGMGAGREEDGEGDDEPPGGYSGRCGLRDFEATTTTTTATRTSVVEDIQLLGTKVPSQPLWIEAITREGAANATGSTIHAREPPHTRLEQDQQLPTGGRTTYTPMPMPMSRLLALVSSPRPLGPAPTYLSSLKRTLTYTPLNVCLAFVPVSWALHHTRQSDTLTFVCSALAIVPLAAQLTLATEQIALRTSQAVGGLVNATFGNVVEMIIGGIALSRCDLALVQSSLLGGLISNLLLVLGTAFIVGGYRFHQQEFQPMAAQLNTSLMTVAVISLLVPAAFHEFLGDRLQGTEGPLLLKLSRGSAIVLILIYIAYLVFQFYSHNDIFTDTYELKAFPDSCRSSTDMAELPILPFVDPTVMLPFPYEQPKINGVTALLVLCCATAFTYVTADNLVSSLNGMVEHSDMSKEWVTLIIIPIISNAAEHTTAAIVASKGKFDLVMSVAVGSCIQIALFVIPALILIAWGLDKPLTLLFDPIETMCLFLSVLLVKFSVGDGKAHWMSGVVLIGVYVLIAISFWDYPQTEYSPLTCN